MPYLVVENGNNRGLKIEIAEGAKVTLGRDAKADVPVSDHLCSRCHFEIRSESGEFVLEDMGSSNGTFVNDERIQRAILRHGDGIQAGETQLTFLLEGDQTGRGLVGKVLGGYRILERIGRGGMGTVYKANQTSLNRTVALKILSPKVAEDPTFVAKFQKEAQAAGRLNHPNIVQVYDVGSDGGLHFYSMEYIENGSVQDLATREGVVETDLAVEIVIDAARGLEYAEKKHLVHRDIKPDNLMVNSEGVVKIADLGLARDGGRNRETGDTDDDEGIFGTPHFIAPEQAQGLAVDTRSDIYSLGASFYRLVTGNTPFQGDNVREIVSKQIHDAPKPVRDINRKVPANVAQIIEKMMEKDPDDRYANASDLLVDLERASARLDGSSNRTFIRAAAVSAIAAAGIAAFVMFSGPNDDEGDKENPKPAPVTAPNPQSQRDEELERKRVEGLRAFGLIKVDDARLIGKDRTEQALTELATRFEAFAGEYTEALPKESEAAANLARRLRDQVKELAAARARAEEAEARKLQSAEQHRDKTIAAADAAAAKGEWGAAVQALVEAVKCQGAAGVPANAHRPREPGANHHRQGSPGLRPGSRKGQ